MEVHRHIVMNMEKCQGWQTTFPHGCSHVIVQSRSVLALFSHSQDVTGIVHEICNKMKILGKVSRSHWFIAIAGEHGLSEGDIPINLFFQCFSSICSSSGDGKIALYLLTISPGLGSFAHKILGIRPSREMAVTAAEENWCSRCVMIWSRKGMATLLRY